ncbi:MAG: alpha/beta hydrolase [Alphaproteobacteria bacterium]|nr:alpha/beta hydrolase [Alphaproteobacteria bacterium]
MAEVFFQGPFGRLEGRFFESENPKAPFVLVLPPSPIQGGTMNNKVTYAIFQAFVNLGFSALRINYHGVGRSQGQMDGSGAGELLDAIAALDWLQSHDIDSNKCWIAGYSFGSWIAAQVLMRRPEIQGFVFATPPTNLYEFNFLSPCPASGVIVQGGADSVVDEKTVAYLAEELDCTENINIDYRLLDGVDHFYTNALKPLHDSIVSAIPDLKLKKVKRGKKFAKAIIPNDDY